MFFAWHFIACRLFRSWSITHSRMNLTGANCTWVFHAALLASAAARWLMDFN